MIHDDASHRIRQGFHARSELSLLDALKAAGCNRIFDDVMRAERKRGDQVLIERLMFCVRVTRSLSGSWTGWAAAAKDLMEFAGKLSDQHIGFISLTDAINTTTASGRFFFHVMASLSQMERDLLVERTQAGLLAAREQGKVGGRKRVMTESKIRSAKNLPREGMAPKDVARDLGVSVPTLYRWIPAGS